VLVSNQFLVQKTPLTIDSQRNVKDDSPTTASGVSGKVSVTAIRNKLASQRGDDGAGKRVSYRSQWGPEPQHLNTHMHIRPRPFDSVPNAAHSQPYSIMEFPTDIVTPLTSPDTPSELPNIPRSHDWQDPSAMYTPSYRAKLAEATASREYPVKRGVSLVPGSKDRFPPMSSIS
jgi:hypothetical protein